MKTFTTLLTVFFLLSICGACTITKRHFEPGYHVEWKHRFSDKEREEPKSAKLPVDEPEKLMAATVIEAENDSTSVVSNVIDSEVKSDSLPATELTPKKSGKQAFLVKSFKLLKITPQSKLSEQKVKNSSKHPKKTSPHVDIFTWLALGLLSLVLTVALIIYLCGLFANPGAIIYLTLFTLGSLAMSIISVKRVFNSPDDYIGKGLTIAVFATSVLLSLGLVFYVFYLFIQAIMNIW